MTVESLHSLQAVPEPAFPYPAGGGSSDGEISEPDLFQKRPARQPARGILKLPGQKGVFTPPEDITQLYDERSFLKATYPPRQQFFNALLEVQEQFIRSFEEISEIPTQLGALFSESAQELAREAQPETDFYSEHARDKEQSARPTEDIQFRKLKKQIDLIKNREASTVEDEQELAVI